MEDILANVPKEGENLNLDLNPENKAQDDHKVDHSAPPAGGEKEKPSPDGANNQDDPNLPFHKHPRWQEMYRSKQELEQKVSEMQKVIEGLSQKEKKEIVQSGQLPSWFVRLFGENQEAYSIMEKEMFGSLEERILNKIQSRQAEEAKAAQEGERYVSSEIKAMHDEGLEFDENEFMKFLVDFKEKYGALPYDSQNRIDMRKGYELWQQFRPPEDKTASNTRKQIADFTTKRSSPSVGKTQKEPEVMTSKDLRHKDWRSLLD